MQSSSKMIVSGVVALFLFSVLAFFWPIATINAGEIGVVTTFGEIEKNSLGPGIHLINPLSTVHKINIRILTTIANSEAASSDLQNVDTQITLNYSLNPLYVKQIYSTLGNDPAAFEQSIINPALSESFKAIVSGFTAEELINKRDIVSHKVNQMIQDKLNKYGIIVQSVSIKRYSKMGWKITLLYEGKYPFCI